MNTKHISNLIEEQFPDFYKSEGETFVQFIKAYYEWEEARSKVRYLNEYRDIDTTLDSFLNYFQSEYMAGIPKEILGDKRLLQKHILDLYRAKGSVEGIRLIFRLLFNEEIEYYIPSLDIFKLDESIWYEPKYLEISKLETNRLFEKQIIKGIQSGAIAVVESYERRSIASKLADILFISNISGNFLINEEISFGDNSIRSTILGSAGSLKVFTSEPNFEIGEEVLVTGNSSGEFLEGIVTAIRNSNQGLIEFVLIDGGFGYRLNSDISITAGSNSDGSGASFEISEISNTINVDISLTQISNYANIELDSLTFDGGEDSSMNTSNISSTVEDALDYEEMTFGKISRIITTDPGTDYDGTVLVNINDPIYSSLQIQDSNGNFFGNNAIVLGNPFYGTGVVSEVKIKNSGFGYHINDEQIVLTNSNNQFTANISISSVGVEEGSWKTTTSFLESDKYLQDDNYYQEYSYEIKVKRKLSEYSEILRKTVHPSGNKMFGRIRLITEG